MMNSRTTAPSRTSRPFDITVSVDELLRDHPSSVIALNAYGIDTCCGGAMSLSDAAREAGISLDHLLVDIERSLAGSAS